jgi:molecular chaperone GrpE
VTAAADGPGDVFSAVDPDPVTGPGEQFGTAPGAGSTGPGSGSAGVGGAAGTAAASSGTAGVASAADITDEQLADEIDADLVHLVDMVQRLETERDGYLADAQRIQAEFANYRRRTEQERTELGQRANERLVAELLPALDACEAAVAHGSAEVSPIAAMLGGILEKQGLVVLNQADIAFDPEVHEAVMSEPGDGTEDGPQVAEVLRTGYTWNGRVVRAAMVKVRG